MYLLNPLENLKTYISSRPPLVIFMVSVSAVAITFLTIGYFFKIKEIKSPEMTEVLHNKQNKPCIIVMHLKCVCYMVHITYHMYLKYIVIITILQIVQ